MRIAIDAMGGDHAPDEIVRGAVLYRSSGGQADLILQPGDRLLLPPNTRHAATVGPHGVRCIEAHRPVAARTAAPR